MTEQLTVAETFRDELATAGIQLRLTSALTYAIDCATREQGWTVPQLVTEALRNNDYSNPGGAITRRLQIIVLDKIAAPKAKQKISKGIPFCSPECKDNAGWLLDVDGNITGRCTCRSGA